LKILVALNNSYIKSELEKKYLGNIYEYDILDMESVIEFLSKNNEPYIVITKDTLDGNLTDKMYIKHLKLANDKLRIIYIVKELTSEYKEFLFANEVLNILEGSTVTIESIIDLIEEDKSVVYKIIDKSSNEKINEAAIEYVVENQIVPKQLIAVYGTSGSGKSNCASILAKNISSKLNISVALLDMDIQNPAIDILNNVEGSNNTLSQIVEDVDKQKEINQIIEKYMIKDKNNKNLWYMTNNTSLFDCQNKLSNKYYNKIYNSIGLKYDYAIVDLPASPFLDVVPYTLLNATKIFFIINPNYISIRQASKYLDLINKLWDIPKEKINIIVNKTQKNSLDKYQIESILKEYKIVANINYNKDFESYINGATSNINNQINMEKIYKSLDIKKTLNNSLDNYTKKNKIIRSMFFSKQNNKYEQKKEVDLDVKISDS
jgi:MinD-like ATPase involved in chromosome partitioning or flagellar assembly